LAQRGQFARGSAAAADAEHLPLVGHGELPVRRPADGACRLVVELPDHFRRLGGVEVFANESRLTVAVVENLPVICGPSRKTAVFIGAAEAAPLEIEEPERKPADPAVLVQSDT